MHEVSSTHGKNSDGDFPLHVVCCDPFASLEAIVVLVDRQVDALAMVDGGQGLLPFHFAPKWRASLDVISYLLQHCHNALHQISHENRTASVGGQFRLSPLGDTKVSTMESLQSTCSDGDHAPVKQKAKR
jgi:hypothetical protein